MEKLTDTYNNNMDNNNANETSHYTLMTLGIFVGFIGVILRFLATWTIVDIVSNIILVIGIIICLISVFRILK